jgi:phenylacetate-CoA ligase
LGSVVGTLGFLGAALARPYLSRSHIQAYQLGKIRELLRFATKHVPFYRDLYRQAGVDPGDIRTLEDYRRLPQVEKHQLWDLQASLPADRSGLIVHRTSGSTGTPAHIYRNAVEERRLNLLRWRMLVMMGLRPGDRLAKVKSTWESLPSRYERLRKLASRIRLVEPRVFDCFQRPEDIHRQLVDFQPDMLSGYPGALVRVAEFHARNPRALKKLRTVLCGGEYLAPHQRRLLESGFRVPVIDTYGTSECNLAAWECRQTGAYHVCDDGVLLEVCEKGVPVSAGQSGEVVITALHSRVMPLIRYRLGDRAVAGRDPCACGSAFSTIEKLQGRVIDYLVLPDGRQLHPFQLLNEVVLMSGDGILEYQVVQEAVDSVRVDIVPRRNVTEKERRQLRSALQQKLGPGVGLQIEWVESIPADRSGKFHFCRSSVRDGVGNQP